MDWKIGKIHWFDVLSGEGLLKDESGKLIFVCQDAIDTDSGTVSDGQVVEFQVISDTTFCQVSRVRNIRD